MSIHKHKLVNGELIELTPEEIAELEERDRNPPPLWPPLPPEETTDAPSRTKRH